MRVPSSRRVVRAGVAGALSLAAVAGCASILSIPDRSADWCNRPENAHDFCDDFDHADAGAQWGPGSTPGSSISYTASGDSPPNALALSTVPQSLGGATVAGLFKQFDDRTFDHVVFAFDVQFIRIDLAAEGGVASQLGFMLLQEQGFCIGGVLTPAGLGMVMRANATDCTSVANIPADAGNVVGSDGVTSYALIGPVPGLNQWLHVKLDVKRSANGSGAVAFSMNYPGIIIPPQIPPGFLTATPPAVAVATSVVGPTGRVDLQFDNVTVDFLKD